MKIPEYVENAIERRRRAARAWFEADKILTQYIEKKGLDTIIPSGDFNGGADGLFEAEESGNRIRQAIIDS